MARFNDKVVFVRGGAKGQRRSHAMRFAGEGDMRKLTDAEAAIPLGVAKVSGGNHPYPEPPTEASAVTGAVLPIDLEELAR